MVLKNFAVIEGCDGSGTTTQVKLLETALKNEAPREPPAFMAAEPKPRYNNPPFFITFEPTHGPVGLLIRRILNGEINAEKGTIARLFAADRGEHLHAPGGILERCNRDELVISDRYTPSSLVYQGLECGPELPEALNSAFPLPELLIYLDIDSGRAMSRIKERKGKKEIYERLEFQTRVRAAYLKLIPEYEKSGVRVLSLDGDKDPAQLAREIWVAVCKMPIMNR